MGWVESIHLLSSEETIKKLNTEFPEHFESLLKDKNIEKIEIIGDAFLPTSIAVVLHWCADIIPAKTKVGLLLAEHLRKKGMVNHSVWLSKFEFKMEPTAE